MEAYESVELLTNQFNIAQAQLNSAANYRNSIVEMIYEAHNIDPKSVPLGTKFHLKDGQLTIGEQSTSERIKSDLNKVSNGHKVK